MRNRLGAALTALLFALLCAAVMLTALYYVGTDDGLYYTLQMKAGVLEEAGVSEADLRALDGALARCLKGRADWNVATGPDGETGPLQVDVFGARQSAFNPREISHMEDCQHLFRMLRAATLYGATAAALALALAHAMRRMGNRRRAIRAACVGAGLVAAPLLAFALWAATDFSAAFAFFHRLLFTNDLWLLDPRTDLLIRICPQSMFAEMGARIGLYSLAGIALLPPVARGALRCGAKICAKRTKRKFYR